MIPCQEFPRIHKPQRSYSARGFFHAVFEACKAYNKMVQSKAQSSKEGNSYARSVGARGVLKNTKCVTDTDRHVQNG